MTTDYPTPISSEQRGCVNRLIAFVCSAYLIFMVGYLIIRVVTGDRLWWISLINVGAVYTFMPLFLLIPLALLIQHWWLLARLSVLAVLGVIWFGPFFQPKTVVPSAMETMRVVSFTLGDEEYLEDDALAEIEEWLRETGADVILLQNIPLNITDLSAITLADFYPQRTNPASTSAPGLLILSRHPIIETTDINAHQQRAVIDLSGQELAIYNLHLPAPQREESRFNFTPPAEWMAIALNYDESERNEQLQMLLEMLRAEEIPYIVGGNFNMSQHSIIYGTLALQMTDSFRSSNSGLGSTWPVASRTWPTPILRLDYIWHSRNLRARLTERGPALMSTHLPLVADLEVLTLLPGTGLPEENGGEFIEPEATDEPEAADEPEATEEPTDNDDE